MEPAWSSTRWMKISKKLIISNSSLNKNIWLTIEHISELIMSIHEYDNGVCFKDCFTNK